MMTMGAITSIRGPGSGVWGPGPVVIRGNRCKSNGLLPLATTGPGPRTRTPDPDPGPGPRTRTRTRTPDPGPRIPDPDLEPPGRPQPGAQHPVSIVRDE